MITPSFKANPIYKVASANKIRQFAIILSKTGMIDQSTRFSSLSEIVGKAHDLLTNKGYRYASIGDGKTQLAKINPPQFKSTTSLLWDEKFNEYKDAESMYLLSLQILPQLVRQTARITGIDVPSINLSKNQSPRLMAKTLNDIYVNMRQQFGLKEKIRTHYNSFTLPERNEDGDLDYETETEATIFIAYFMGDVPASFSPRKIASHIRNKEIAEDLFELLWLFEKDNYLSDPGESIWHLENNVDMVLDEFDEDNFTNKHEAETTFVQLKHLQQTFSENGLNENPFAKSKTSFKKKAAQMIRKLNKQPLTDSEQQKWVLNLCKALMIMPDNNLIYDESIFYRLQEACEDQPIEEASLRFSDSFGHALNLGLTRNPYGIEQFITIGVDPRKNGDWAVAMDIFVNALMNLDKNGEANV